MTRHWRVPARCRDRRRSPPPTAMAVSMLAIRSRHASGVPLSGCARHGSSGSRVPVQSVTSRVPIAGAAATRTARRRSPSAAHAGSGWIMLKVPETAAISTPDAADAARIAVAVSSGIASGSGSSPEQAMLYCATPKPAVRDRRQHRRADRCPGKSWRRCRAASHRSGGLGELDRAVPRAPTARSRPSPGPRRRRPRRSAPRAGRPVSTASAKPSTWRR